MMQHQQDRAHLAFFFEAAQQSAGVRLDGRVAVVVEGFSFRYERFERGLQLVDLSAEVFAGELAEIGSDRNDRLAKLAL
jgi:hypothetical protein